MSNFWVASSGVIIELLDNGETKHHIPSNFPDNKKRHGYNSFEANREFKEAHIEPTKYVNGVVAVQFFPKDSVKIYQWLLSLGIKCFIPVFGKPRDNLYETIEFDNDTYGLQKATPGDYIVKVGKQIFKTSERLFKETMREAQAYEEVWENPMGHQVTVSARFSKERWVASDQSHSYLVSREFLEKAGYTKKEELGENMY